MTLPKKWVKPRHGIILAGIPASGAEVSGALAKEWIEAGLVEEIEDPNEEKGKKIDRLMGTADKPKEG